MACKNCTCDNRKADVDHKVETLPLSKDVVTTPTDPMLRFFPDFASSLYEYTKLAHFLVRELPSGPERTVALRKLLESLDCAKRAKL